MPSSNKNIIKQTRTSKAKADSNAATSATNAIDSNKRRTETQQHATTIIETSPRRSLRSSRGVRSLANDSITSPTNAVEVATTTTTIPPVVNCVNMSWVSGVDDIRSRAAQLCRILADLYFLRRDENDRFRGMHWRKIANILDEHPSPIVSLDQVESLISISGIGAATISVLTEVQATGFIDWINDLLVQTNSIVEDRGGPNAEKNLLSIEVLHQRANDLGARNAERRLERAARIRERHPIGETAILPATICIVEKGVRITGKERRELVQGNNEGLDLQRRRLQQQRCEDSLGVHTRRMISEMTVKDTLQAIASRGGNADDACCICLDVYDDSSSLVAFLCSHIFHYDCLLHWVQQRVKNSVSPSCPTCRRPLVL